jgi:hypothetical protein
MAVELESCLPGNVTTSSLNTIDVEMTALKCIKILTHFQHLDNNEIHFGSFYFRASCHVGTPDMHFVGANSTPADIA